MVFISWSKDASRRVTLALRDWLPQVIQHIPVWVSDVDIAAGARSATEIAAGLNNARSE
jgi:hypothetical protein